MWRAGRRDDWALVLTFVLAALIIGLLVLGYMVMWEADQVEPAPHVPNLIPSQQGASATVVAETDG